MIDALLSAWRGCFSVGSVVHRPGLESRPPPGRELLMKSVG